MTTVRTKITDFPMPPNIDNTIARILYHGLKKPGASFVLDQDDVKAIVLKARQIFKEQPMLLELNAPVHVLGDTHGDLPNLVQILEMGGNPKSNNYLFLGDMADRGKFGLEVLVLLFAFKCKRPENFFLLRGNHESDAQTSRYGFKPECVRKQNRALYSLLISTFNHMPVAAIVADKIFCCHGGPSFNMESMVDIINIPRPIEIPDSGLLADLLWNDPSHDVDGWATDRRGIGYAFGKTALREWMKKHKIELVLRAHQVVESGYEFFDSKRLCTLFSAPNYSNGYSNKAAIIKISPDLELSVKTINPPRKYTKNFWMKDFARGL